MKKLFVLLALGLLCLAATADGTLVSMKFTYDDGSPVIGTVVLFRAATPADVKVASYTLDAQGRVSGDIALDPTATYHAQLLGPTGALLQEVWTVNMSSALASAVLNTLPTGEVDVVLSKLDASVKNVQFTPFSQPASTPQLLPQTKLASCASNPRAVTGTTSDTGGGLVVGYITNGQTFDCQVNVSAAGTYSLNIRAASGSAGGGRLHFEYPAGTTVGTPVAVSFTGSNYDTYQTFPAGNASLPQGTVTIRLVVDSTSLNLNWLN